MPHITVQYRGTLLTLGTLVSMELLRRMGIEIIDPAPLVFVAVVYAGLTGGLGYGMISAAITLLYFLYFYSQPEQPFRYTDRDLQRIIVLAIASPLPALIAGILKRQMERNLDSHVEGLHQAKAAEIKFQGILESAPDAIVTSDREGRIVLVNSQAEKMFGYRRDELVGKPVEILVPEALREAHVGHRKKYYGDPRTRAMGVGLWYDLAARRKDGSTLPVDIALSPLKIDAQLLVTAVIRDITERKRLQEEIRRQQRQRAALYGVNLAITSTLDRQAVLGLLLEKIGSLLPYPIVAAIRLVNRESGLLEPIACLNLDLEEWKKEKQQVGEGISDIVAETETPLIIGNLLTDPRIQNPKFFHKHGLVSYLGAPLAAKGEVLGVISICTKEERLFSKEEIEFFSTLAGQAAIAINNSQLYEQTKAQAEDLERANKVKGEFLSVISHELRTPLNTVIGYAAMIHDGFFGEIKPEQKQALHKVATCAQELLTMINSILEVTKIEAAATRVESQEINPADLLDEMRSLQDTPTDKELSLSWDYPNDLPVIRTDIRKLRQILESLIHNAIKFTAKGQVAISARYLPETKVVEFQVKDTGIGIPKEALPLAFEKFYKVDSSETRPYGGMGLGLYVVKQFIELVGGTVEVESELGKGSTFTVTIPEIQK